MKEYPSAYSGKRVIDNVPRSRRKRKSSPILLILTILFGAAFLLSAVMVIRYYVRGNAEEAAFTELAAIAAQPGDEQPDLSTETPASSDPAEAPLPEAEESEAVPENSPAVPSGYETLYAMNSDFVGWLSVPGTKIDYPVMLTPDDPQYYLRRAFDKSSSVSGTPFIGLNGTPDTDCFIIYGHNMKNKTMFGTLSSYQDRNFWDTSPTFSFDTLYENRTYQVFAAVECRILEEGEVGIRYYDYSGDLTEEEYGELTEWLLANSAYDTGIVPSYGEQILILSTCSYHTTNGRFIIAARRIS